MRTWETVGLGVLALLVLGGKKGGGGVLDPPELMATGGEWRWVPGRRRPGQGFPVPFPPPGGRRPEFPPPGKGRRMVRPAARLSRVAAMGSQHPGADVLKDIGATFLVSPAWEARTKDADGNFITWSYKLEARSSSLNKSDADILTVDSGWVTRIKGPHLIPTLTLTLPTSSTQIKYGDRWDAWVRILGRASKPDGTPDVNAEPLVLTVWTRAADEIVVTKPIPSAPAATLATANITLSQGRRLFPGGYRT